MDRSGTAKRVNNSAFTLVELLVVVACISFLMAVLLPALYAARTPAWRIRCAGHLRAVALGWVTYAEEDNQGKFLLERVGANPEFEFGGWPGDPLYGYATYRPVNRSLGLEPNAARAGDTRVFRCPADTGDEGYPAPFYEQLGNSYRTNTALGCSGNLPEYIKEPWRTIHRDVNRQLKGLLCANVPALTLLVGDYNWLTQLDPLWTVACAKSWHGRRHYYNLAFRDGHVAHTRIRKGLYDEQGLYRWQPFTGRMDDEVQRLQKPVTCPCGRE